VLFVYLGQFLASLFQFDGGIPTIRDATAVGQLAVLVLVVVPPFLVSFVVPIFVPRYAAPAGVGVIVLAARGLRNVPLGAVRAGLLSVVVASSLLFVGVYYVTEPLEPWESVSSEIERTAGPGDVVINQPGGAVGHNIYADYYLRDAAVTTETLPESTRIRLADVERLQRLVGDHERVVLVRYNGFEGPAVSYLGACYGSSTQTLQDTITVYQFEGVADCPKPATFMAEWSGTPPILTATGRAVSPAASVRRHAPLRRQWSVRR